MSLDALIQQLQSNAASAYERRTAADQNMAQMAATFQQQMAQQNAQSYANRPVGNRRGSSNARYRGKGAKGLINPVKGASISSNYGSRIHPITGGHSNHTGVDFAVGLGTPIRAVTNGIVREANSGDKIYGNQLILGHGKNFQTMYGHMDSYDVKPGQRVKKGQIIGYVGSTGLSTGPHLHFETWRNGTPINPMKFL